MGSGLAGLGPSTADLAVMGERLGGRSQFTMPTAQAPVSIAVSPSSNKVFVQGIVFDADDAASALESEKLLSAPGTGLPSSGDWVPLDAQAYGQYLESIRNPSLWRLAKKNFGRGVDAMQALAGRGLQLAGAEETGGRIVAQQEADLAKTSPFERQFTDIGEPNRGVLDWFVANLAQQGPNLLESVAVGLGGFAAGTAVGGNPLAGAGAALAGLAGKSAFKQSVMAAARKRAAGEALTATENKLLREAAGIAGATAASYTQNLATGAADIYGELRDQGANADDVDARLKALAGSIPYAAIETLPEFLLASRVLSGLGAPRAITPGTPLRARAGELLKRGTIGGAVGGTAEGSTELGQEALLLGISGQSLTSDEAQKRLINSFAAGFGVGGPIGAVANLRGRKAENLLDPGSTTEPPPPVPPTPGTALAPIQPGPMPPSGTPWPPGAPTPPTPPVGIGSPAIPLLPGPTPAVTPVGGTVMMVTPEGQAYPDQMLRQAGNVPPGAPGTQGVLDVFGGTISAQELATRMQPGVPPVPGAVAPTGLSPQEAAAQGQLQFAPPAPEATAPTAVGNALQRAMRRRQEEQILAQRQAQEAAQREADLERMAIQAANQRQLDIMAEAQRPAPAPALPMVPITPRQPRQLPLFTRRQAPVPPKAGQLRRGRKMQPAPAAQPDRGIRQATLQLPMFTAEGEPSLPALKSAGVKRKVAAAPTPAPAKKTAGARGLKRGAKVVAVEVKEAPSVADTVRAVVGQAAVKLQNLPQKGDVLTFNDNITKANPTRGRQKVVVDRVEEYRGRLVVYGTVWENGNDVTTGIMEAVEFLDPNGEVYKTEYRNTGLDRFFLSNFKETQKLANELSPISQGEPRAVQKPSAAPVPPQPAAKTRAGVGKKVPSEEKAAGKGAALKRGKKEEVAPKKAPAPKKEPAPPKAEGAAAPAPQMKAAAFRSRKTGEVVETGPVHNRYKLPGGYASDLKEWEAGFVDTRGNFYNREEAARAIGADKKELRTEDFGVLTGLQPPAPAPTETAEERWAGMEDMPFTDLPAELQTRWRDAVAKNQATGELAAQIVADAEAEVTAEPTDALGDAINTVDEAVTAKVTPEVREALRLISEYAFFTTEDTNTRALVERARAWLGNTTLSESQRAALDDVVLAQVNETMRLEAVYTRGANKGTPKPWFSYASSRGMLFNIRSTLSGLSLEQAKDLVAAGKLKLSNLPADTQRKLGDVAAPATVGSTPGNVSKSESTVYRAAHTPQSMLGLLIDNLISRVSEITRLNQKVRVARGIEFTSLADAARTLYAQVSAEGRKYIVRGYPLSDYFTADGEPKIIKSAGRYIIGTQQLTPTQQAALEKAQRDEAAALAAEEAAARLDPSRRLYDQYDDANGAAFRDDGTPITKNVPVGRIRLLVKGFLSKLMRKPTVHIYANAADLKARNPELYRRAAAAREQGDFGTIKAVGYSFGKEVIVFSDFVRTEQQLRFVLAHETMGHFGFRAVIPGKELDAILERIYDADADVQSAVEAMMSVQGMSKLEAIEEYVADNAAVLDTSLIARIWNTLKNFLNKLGLKFQDDEARYLVNLARKYVRRGEGGNFFNARAVAEDIQLMESDRGTGMYARAGYGDALERAFAVGNGAKRFGGSSGLLGAMEAFGKRAFGKREDVPGTVARVLEHVQTLSNKARRSFGLSEIYRLLENQQQYARQLLSKYSRMTTLTHTPTVFGYGGGVTEEEKLQAGELLAHAALLRSKQATDDIIKSFDDLVYVDAMGNIQLDTKVRDQLEKRGMVSAEEFRNGFDIEYDDGKDNISKVRFQRDIDENSNVWKIYEEQRAAVNEAAIDLMLSNYEASQTEAKRVIGDLNARRRGANAFTEQDLAAIRKVAERYRNMRFDGADVASAAVNLNKRAAKESEDFLIAFGRALFNDDVLAAWMGDPRITGDMKRDFEQFQGAEYDDVRAALPGLRAKFSGSKDANEQQSFRVQKAVRDIFLFDLQAQNADYYAKRTILGAYVPFTRRGTEQVRLVAYDKRGNPVPLSENVRSILPYFQFESRSEATAAAEELETTFGGDNEWTLYDEDGAEVTVSLRPEVSRVRQSPDLTEAVNFNEFVYVLNRLNVNLAPEVRERIITTLTSQNSRARKNLQRSGTPGWDKDVVRSVSEHLETSAHVSAKKLYRNRLDDILLNNDNWFGDPERLQALQDAVDNAATDGERARAQREYDQYAHMYRYMASSAGKKTVKVAGEEVPTLGRGEDYREYAKEVLRWYSDTSNITDSTEDLFGEAGSRLKLVTVLMQLGGSVASAALNLISIPTHSLPYLASYNPARGFGGGYGMAKAANALWKALRDVRSPKLAEAEDFDKIMRDGTWAQYGLTEDEAQFLFAQTEQGTLQAAQFNALVGTARGKVFSNKAQAAVKLWMSMFSYTEQLNRRATALAAYRMEKDRALAQGLSEEQAIAEAAEAARTAVNTAQGEYAMFNRPTMARGPVLQYVFVYKQFAIITVELLRNMPKDGQLMMLGFLLLLSGLKGLPFAEDLMDIVDTIAQMLGLPMASVEKAAAEWIDSVAPGVSPYVMKGVLDKMTGATVSTRVGMGDLLPLTGAFRAGASPIQELQDFAGPVVGGMAGLVGTAASLTQYGAEVIGLRPDTTSLTGILRNAPLAAVRAFADGYAYMEDGRITNAKGQVVTADVGAHTVIARMMGFYPAIATEQNDIVRLSKYVAEYSKAVKTDFVQAYVKAKLDGDAERMAQIRADVDAWNVSAKGTGLEITQFARSANRAALEAERPTALRYLKSAPKNVRPETLEMLRLNGIDPQELTQP
jgi:hypothetical protein